jgi:hypothetical protein
MHIHSLGGMSGWKKLVREKLEIRCTILQQQQQQQQQQYNSLPLEKAKVCGGWKCKFTFRSFLGGLISDSI